MSFQDERAFREWITMEQLKRADLEARDIEGGQSVRRLWQRWETQGIAAPAKLETMIRSKDETHTQDVFTDVFTAAVENASMNPGRVWLGQVPLAQLEASISPGKDGYFLVVDTFLEGFLSFACFAAVACAFESSTESDVEDYTAGFFREMDKFLGVGDWDLQTGLFERMVSKSYEGAMMAGYTQLGLTTFILSHELGHVFHGHLTRTMTLHLHDSPNSSIEVISNSHIEELEADEFGLKLYQHLQSDTDRWPTVKLESLYDAVPLFLFDLLDVLELRTAVLSGQGVDGSSHPLPMRRKSNLLDQFPKILHPRSASLYDGLLEFADHLRENVTRQW